MTIIGITGGSGAGKTSALRTLASLGALVVDCDAVYHELLSRDAALIRALENRFEGVVSGGVLDRRALGRIVFADSAALSDLNAIAHRYVADEVVRRLKEWEASGGQLAAIEAIALIESGLGALCGIVVGVTAPMDIRARRIMARDGVSCDEARLRINAQKPDEYFYENCDYVLQNDFMTGEEFEKECRIFFTQILGGTTNA